MVGGFELDPMCCQSGIEVKSVDLHCYSYFKQGRRSTMGCRCANGEGALMVLVTTCCEDLLQPCFLADPETWALG